MLLAIDSPGGTTTGAEAVYLALRKLAEKKPTVAVVSNTAASGAYIAALGADRIFVRGGSLVGSIGVLAEIQSLYKGLDMIGVKVDEFKSSPLKNAPNGFEPTSEAARAAIMALIDDNYVWFKGLVKERRGLTDAGARQGRRRARLHRPAGGALSSPTPSAARARRSTGSSRRRASPKNCRFATGRRSPSSISWVFSASPRPHCAHLGSRPSPRRSKARWSLALRLTACWPFGKLRRVIELE